MSPPGPDPRVALRLRLAAGITFGRRVYACWTDNHVPLLGAALAYYGVFSLGPLLLIAIAIAGGVLGSAAVQRQVFAYLAALIGADGAAAVGLMLHHAFSAGHGALATAVGVATLVLGASGLFGQLQDAIDMIWRAPAPPGRGLLPAVRDQALQVSFVMVTGMLLVATMLVSAAISAVEGSLGHWLPTARWPWRLIQLMATFAALCGLFGLIFKTMPRVRLGWHDVWLGAAVTSGLVTLGEVAIGRYLAVSAPGSVYGAAGALVVVMVWMYYSAQVFFLGVVITKVLAEGPPGAVNRMSGGRAAPDGEPAGTPPPPGGGPAGGRAAGGR